MSRGKITFFMGLPLSLSPHSRRDSLTLSKGFRSKPINIFAL